MKVCKKCGAIQEDDHTTCIDCEEILGSPISKEKEAEINDKVAGTITKLSNRTDYFYVSKFDKVIAAFHLIGALTLFIMIYIIPNNIIRDFAVLNIIAAINMILVAIDLRFPRLAWALYKLEFILSVSNTDDIQPSDLVALLKRKFSYVILAIGYILIAIIIIKTLKSL